jgi:hypothetical protein
MTKLPRVEIVRSGVGHLLAAPEIPRMTAYTAAAQSGGPSTASWSGVLSQAPSMPRTVAFTR